MTTLVAALVLASAVAHASWNALLKGRRGDPLAASTGLALSWVLLTAPLLFWLPLPPAEAAPHLIASILIHGVYFALLTAAYRIADLSLVYPIARGLPPLLVAGVTWAWAAERPSLLGGLGVGGIGLGVLALGLTASPSKPAESSQAPSEAPLPRPARSRSLLLALGTAALIATYTVVDGLGVRAGVGPARPAAPVSYWAWLTVGEGLLFGLGALIYGGRALAKEVYARRGVALLSGALSAGGYAIAIWAMSRAPIALVAALRETSVLFAAAIGALFLKEPLGKKRIAAAALIALSAVLVRLGG